MTCVAIACLFHNIYMQHANVVFFSSNTTTINDLVGEGEIGKKFEALLIEKKLFQDLKRLPRKKKSLRSQDH